jgi:hypothetical protein
VGEFIEIKKCKMEKKKSVKWESRAPRIGEGSQERVPLLVEVLISRMKIELLNLFS